MRKLLIEREGIEGVILCTQLQGDAMQCFKRVNGYIKLTPPSHNR